MADKNLSRIRRQFDALGRGAPPVRGLIDVLMRRRMAWLRVPASLLLIAGGVFSFLPVLGLWMLPLGFLLLAVDVPPLRFRVAAGTIWARRRFNRWVRRGKKAAAQR